MIRTIFALILLSTLTACATSSYSFGRAFPTENVKQIVKGKTTGAELVLLFGEPFAKTVISETEEKWIYTHSSGTASAQSYVFTTKVQTTGQQKSLDILLKNGMVTNFTYTEGSGPIGTIQ